MLYTSPYTTQILQWLSVLAVLLYKPFWSCSNTLFSLGMPTTVEKKKPWKLFWRRFGLISPLIVICILFFPFAFVGFLMRIALYCVRRPYRLSVKLSSSNEQTCPQSNQFGVGTMNLCLLPEYYSRQNNLSHASYRASEIGKRLVVDQMFYNGQNNLDNMKTRKSTHNRNQNVSSKLTGGITTHFPNLDFLCIQEAWLSDYSAILKDELHKVYPYIICDVGIYSKKSNYFLLNSGLMFASKYKILDADFKYFGSSCTHGVYMSKGLLMVKVLLWYENIREDKAVVGYLYVTHLQAYQGLECVTSKQLDDLVRWTDEFREATRLENDVVAFDIVSGDLNIDNISPGDKVSREHEIFNIYQDEGRVKAGVDQTWTIGTEMRLLNMFNDEVITPEGLKTCLESPLKRQQYICDADIVEASLESLVYTPPKAKVSPIGGKRRIDYILYNKHFPVNPMKYNFVTRFATLTDHIPVIMQFTVPENLQ